jgi:RNA polymerase sigma factor (sigma-70 family)
MKAEQWLEQKDALLRTYATSLSRRSPNNMYEANDLFQIMYMKIWMQAKLSPAFMAQSDSYILKVAWNEGLYALRKQRRYELVINSSSEEVQRSFMNFEESQDTTFRDDNFSVMTSDQPGIESELSNKELIQQAVASLPQKSQQIVSYLYAGYKPGQIMKEMHLSSRSHYLYYVRKIQEAFQSYGLQASI